MLSGPDHLAHQGFLDGCSACISGLANVCPEGVSLIWKHFRDGNIEKSKAAQDFIGGLRKDLYAVAFPPAAVKKPRYCSARMLATAVTRLRFLRMIWLLSNKLLSSMALPQFLRNSGVRAGNHFFVLYLVFKTGS